MKFGHLLEPARIGLGLSLWVLVFSPLPSPAQETPINQKIANFCLEHQGQEVGNGNCFALAYRALIDAGGEYRFRQNPGRGDYVWGDLVYYFERDGSATNSVGNGGSILPGDIIQFRDCRFGGNGWWQDFEHHTAVIVGIKDDGKALIILHQACDGKNFVTALTIRPEALEKGWFRVYRPLQATKKVRPQGTP